MAESRRNQKYLGIDTSVLVPYLVPDHPDHEKTKSLKEKRYVAVNPTVLHETYHTCVFKLRRKPAETVRTLLDYMEFSYCLQIDSATVKLGLKLGLQLSLGGRDALILASYAASKDVKAFVTLDNTLLAIKSLKIEKKTLRIIGPESVS